MTQAFDAQNPPFDRLTHHEVGELKAALDIGYYAPDAVIVQSGQDCQYLHVIIKGSVEERDGDEVSAVLGPKDSFDARAVVHGAAGSSHVAREETLCFLVPKAIVLDLIRRNPGFAAFFYKELSRKLADYASQRDAEGVEQVLRARVGDARLHPAAWIEPEKSLREAAEAMAHARTNALLVRRGDDIGVVTGSSLAKAVLLRDMPHDTQVGALCAFDLVTVENDDFVFEALIKMTRHNKRRLAVTENGVPVGMLEDIDILGLVAGNSQLIPGRIDRARTVDELIEPAQDIQNQVERLSRQGVKVEVIAEITSDLNRGLMTKLFELVAPPSIRDAGCLVVMGSEGRGEQTVRTDQDNGLLLAGPVPAAELEKFRHDFSASLASFGFPPCPGNVMVSNPQWSQTIDEFLVQIRGWVLTPDELSAMNLGIFFDAVPITGKAELLARAKAELTSLMQGETAYLIKFARAIDQFEDASAGVITSLMASVGVASGIIHLKKSGTFPIVHGIRTIAIEWGITETRTSDRIDALARANVLSDELARDLKSALSYFMEMRLHSQLRAMKTGRHDEEAVVRVNELSTRDRDLLRDALKVVKRLREVVRNRYHLGMF